MDRAQAGREKPDKLGGRVSIYAIDGCVLPRSKGSLIFLGFTKVYGAVFGGIRRSAIHHSALENIALRNTKIYTRAQRWIVDTGLYLRYIPCWAFGTPCARQD